MKRLFLLLSALCAVCCTPEQTSWVAIGDSITYLNDHPEQTGYRVQKGYLTRVMEALPGLTCVNKGYNGWTTEGIAERFDELDIPRADLYTVLLGTNDWWQGRHVGTPGDYRDNTGSETIYGAFRVILDKIKALNPRATVILLTPLQRGDFCYLADFTNNAHGSYLDRQGQGLDEVAQAVLAIGGMENLEVVDLYNQSGIDMYNMVRFKRVKDPATGLYRDLEYPGYAGIPFDPAADEYPYPEEAVGMTYDGLHPSDRGNEIIARMLWERILDLMPSLGK